MPDPLKSRFSLSRSLIGNLSEKCKSLELENQRLHAELSQTRAKTEPVQWRSSKRLSLRGSRLSLSFNESSSNGKRFGTALENLKGMKLSHLTQQIISALQTLLFSELCQSLWIGTQTRCMGVAYQKGGLRTEQRFIVEALDDWGQVSFWAKLQKIATKET